MWIIHTVNVHKKFMTNNIELGSGVHIRASDHIQGITNSILSP